MENEYPQVQVRAALADAILAAEPTLIADALLWYAPGSAGSVFLDSGV